MKIRHGIAALVLALPLSGCALGIPALIPSQPTTSDPAPARSAPAAPTMTPDSAPSDEPQEDVELTFGETALWDDGIEVTIGKPKSFTPSEYAIFDKKADDQVKFKVTLKNGTGKTIDPSMFSVTATTGEDEAEQIFDGDDIGSYPSTKLRAGRSVTFYIGFSLNKGEVTMEVSPDWDHDSVLYIATVR